MSVTDMAETGRLSFPAGHPAFPDHFPGNPLVPGALLLDETLAVLALARGLPYEALEVRQAKFVQPVRPDQPVDISWEGAGAGPMDVSLRVADVTVAVLTVGIGGARS